MNESATNSKPTRRALIQAAVGVAILAAAIAAGWYLTSPQFRDWAKGRLVARLEQITGGRVEIAKLDWRLSRLEFDVHGLTIHGLEGPDQVPYFHADRVRIEVRIVSLWRREITLDALEVDRPTAHLIVYPDGHTNQPKPRVETQSSTQTVFDLAIKHAELRNGELMFNDRTLPFELSAADLQAGMKFRAKESLYQGNLKVVIENARYNNYRTPSAGVDVEFTLRPNELGIAGFHMVSGDSKLDASGKVNNFANVAAKIDYRATLSAMDFARTFRQPELKRGKVELSGTATYEKPVLVTQGKLVARGVSYSIPDLRIPNIDAAADYTADDKKLTLTHLVGRALGGIARGDVVVKFEGVTAGNKVTEQDGLVRLSVDNMAAGMVAEAFSTPELRLTALHPAGWGKGTVNIRWRGDPSRAVVELNVGVTSPTSLGDNETPVTGDLKGSYDVRSQQLRAESLHVEMPMLVLSANGTLNSTKEPLHLTAEVSDLHDLQPVLAIFDEQTSAAGELSGSLQFSGDLQGKLPALSIDGHLQTENLTFPLAAIWTPPPPLKIASTTVPRQPRPNNVRIDSGSGDVLYSPQEVHVHNAMVRRAGAQAQLNFSAGLSSGAFTDSSPVAMHLMIHDAALADLQQIAGYNYPISGTVAGEVSVHGTRLDLQGGGHLRVTDGLAYGQTIRSASADIRFANQEAQVNNLVLLHDHAQINGSAAYNLKQESFTFQTTGNNFELATIPALDRNHIVVTGRLNFTASGSGTLDAPLVNASAHLQNLVVNGQRVGDARLLAVTKGDTMHLTARSNFQTAEVDLDGNIRLREQMPAKVNLRFSNFDFMPFLQSVFQTNLNGQSYVGGTVAIEGPLRNPAALTLTAEIPKLTAEMQGVEMHNVEPIRVSMTNELVRLESLHLEGTDTQFRAGGTINLEEDRTINLHADGRLNLKLVQSFNSDLNSGGSVDVHLVVGGAVSKPNLVGEVKISNGAVSLIDFPNGLSSINGTLVFNEQRIQVQDLTARTGGGDLRIGGFATYNPGFAFNVTVQGKDVRMRYPQGVSTTGNLDLKLVGTLNSSTLSGDVTITRFALNSQFDFATYLAKSSRPPEPPRSSPLNNVRFNIHVVSTPQLQVESSLAKVAGNADLRIRGTPTNPVLLGRINITDGRLNFNGSDYRLDRGDISFVNPTHTEPTIDVAATTRVRDYDITLRFSGEPSRGLKTNYSSDPPLPAPDIINLLAFGQTREEAQIEATQGTQTMTETVSNAILGQAINNAVSNRVQKLFGVSRVKISPEVGGAQTNPTAQVTIEQQVSNRVTVTYISNLTQSSQQSIFVEYYFDRNVSLIAGRDQYGVVSFNVRIRQRKR